MKRSKMLDLIYNELMCMNRLDNVAMNILNIVDEHMLPPDTLPNSCSMTTNGRKIDRDEYIFSRFRWEDE